MTNIPRWKNQEEALQFVLERRASILDMDMGTGKTRVAVDAAMTREDVHRVLVACPKAVMPVWKFNLQKFYPGGRWDVWAAVGNKTVDTKAEDLLVKLRETDVSKLFVVVNYDIVKIKSMSDVLMHANFDMVIADESHRIKGAGTKVSRTMHMIGKRVKYRLCLSGTPMSNSPLDLYGQFRFLNQSVFGTRYDVFQQQYAVMSTTTPPFVVGYKNQTELMGKFSALAYSCRMDDIRDMLKLPERIPPVISLCRLPPADMRTSKNLSKEFVAECGGGVLSLNNVLSRILRLQQITSGFAVVQDPDNPIGPGREVTLNNTKAAALRELLLDASPVAHVVVFCLFTRDVQAVIDVARQMGRGVFEMSGSVNQLDKWKVAGGVLAVQIHAGAEGVDMTESSLCIYYSLPVNLAMFEQSMARLYRPGAERPVTFVHLLAEGTIDESVYEALTNKRDLLDDIRNGRVDFGMLKGVKQ